MLLSKRLFTAFALFVCLSTIIAISTARAATFTVTKAADTNDTVCDTDCSLREAIMAANQAFTDDVINFDPTVFSTMQTIRADYGDFEINGNGSLVINGSGSNLLTLTGNNIVRIFTLISNANVTINGITLRDGGGRGSTNFLSGGGGIYNLDGQLTINNSSILNNKVFYDSGGAIRNGGTLSLNNSTVSGNSTEVTSGLCGGGIYNASGSHFNLTDSNISNNTSGNNQGGGVCNAGDVTTTINNSTLSNNTTTFDHGGGIYNSSGRMSISRSIFSNNRILGNSTYGTGGAIYNNGILTITDSTFSDNSANAGGAIINNSSGNLSITASTFNDNSANGNGGGISNGGITSLANSTVSGNTAIISGNNFDGGNGGGIINSGLLSLSSVTVNNNRAISNGGGVQNNGGTVNVLNTIIADNQAYRYGAQDFAGILTSGGHNLIENTYGTTITGVVSGNILGQDPQLFPLRDNGGPTKTVALAPTSLAIDSGDPSNFIAIDQRGFSRPQDGDLNGSTVPDIGAYETQLTLFTVTKTTDTNDALCDADCSLREAITATNTAPTPDNLIVFDPSVFTVPQLITLTNGEIVIINNRNLTLNGTGANLLRISGNNSSRIFSINTGATVAIYNTTITGGNSAANGGGIFNNGNLLIKNSSFSNSTAVSYGGGIFNGVNSTLDLRSSIVSSNIAVVGGGVFSFNGSKLTVTNSTVNNNSASSGFGGGISNNSGTLVLNNSTISGNSGSGIYNGGVSNLNSSTISSNTADGSGAGIFNDGTLLLESSTVANNRAGSQGGGIKQNDGEINVHNSIIADNTAMNSASDFSGYFNSEGFNLIESISGTTIGGSTSGNIIGRDPQLLPLGNYGGLTSTHALKLTSPAIDAGNVFIINIDQRGRPRPYDFPTVPNASFSNGSDIGAFERQVTDLGGSTMFDFDGDGMSDVSVYRPSNGRWYRLNSGANNSVFNTQFGIAEDKIAPADFNGDGKSDLAVFRPSNGVWYRLLSSNNSFAASQFGQTGDIPAPADFDGDGKADLAVFRPSTGVWYVLKSAGGVSIVTFGQQEDVPQAGDFDGDGKADISLYRPSNGVWYRINSSDNSVAAQVFGSPGDLPDAMDFDADGKTDLAVFRPSTGVWYLQQSTAGFAATQFGVNGDRPAAADFDGDGKADIAVFRPSSGVWYLNRSTAGFFAVQFGQSGDVPAESAFVPSN